LPFIKTCPLRFDVLNENKLKRVMRLKVEALFIETNKRIEEKVYFFVRED
jgi:hypothetical protein